MPLWRLIRRIGSSLHAEMEGNDIAGQCVVALGDGVTDLEFKLRDRVAHPALTKLGTGETKVHYAYDRSFTRHIATWLGVLSQIGPQYGACAQYSIEYYF